MKRRLDRVASLPVLLLRGTVIDSASRSAVKVLDNAVVGVNALGRITFVEDGHPELLAPDGELVLRTGAPDDVEGVTVPLAGVKLVTLPPRAFLCPGFVDTHTHAPQFAFAGLGYDLQLLEWLETYTFPSEAKFTDLNYAANVCGNAVKRTLLAGSTSCVYFGTLHTDAAVLLGETARSHGQRAFVGKVNMDRNAPDTYRETTQQSIDETERFVRLMLAPKQQRAAEGDKLNGSASGASGASSATASPTSGAKGPLPVPVITPRFVPTCTSELMTALGGIAKQHGESVVGLLTCLLTMPARMPLMFMFMSCAHAHCSSPCSCASSHSVRCLSCRSRDAPPL